MRVCARDRVLFSCLLLFLTMKSKISVTLNEDSKRLRTFIRSQSRSRFLDQFNHFHDGAIIEEEKNKSWKESIRATRVFFLSCFRRSMAIILQKRKKLEIFVVRNHSSRLSIVKKKKKLYRALIICDKSIGTLSFWVTRVWFLWLKLHTPILTALSVFEFNKIIFSFVYRLDFRQKMR